MRIVTYQRIKQLAAQLAGRTTDNLPPTEVEMLRAFFAAELPELWNREAWPELCDHLEAVTLDANNCFSKRLDATDEMGDILAIIEGGNPLTTNQVTVLGKERYVDLNGRVNILAPNIGTSPADTAGTLYVDWQTPCPDLLDTDYDTAATLNALTVPERFLLPLAARGAALLVEDEDPGRAGKLRALAESTLLRMRVATPWWRKGGQ